MSVIVMIRLDADPKKFEEFAAENGDRMKAISDRAVGRGVIAHRFLGNDEAGQTMVVDEWESAEQFLAFFEDTNPEIGAIMGEVGVTNEPKPEFWRVLESHDKIGWEN